MLFERIVRLVRNTNYDLLTKRSLRITALTCVNAISACVVAPATSATQSLSLQLTPLDASVDTKIRETLVEGQVIAVTSSEFGGAELVTFGCFGGLCLGSLQSDTDYQLHAASWAPVEPGEDHGVTAVFTSPRNLVITLLPNGRGTVSDGLTAPSPLTWRVAG